MNINVIKYRYYNKSRGAPAPVFPKAQTQLARWSRDPALIGRSRSPGENSARFPRTPPACRGMANNGETIGP